MTRTAHQIEVDEAVALATSEQGETVSVWFWYYDGGGVETSYKVEATAIVRVHDAKHQYRNGEEVVTNGFVKFMTSDFTKAELDAEGSVKLADGSVYPVRHIHLEIRGNTYIIQAVDEPFYGRHKCHVIANDKRYSNSTAFDPN